MGQKYSGEEWEPVSIPHTWNARDAFDDVQGYYRGTGTYKKTVWIPKQDRDKVLVLNFEGANQETHVYVNGELAGSHKGGYTEFKIPISDYLNYGENNELLIKVTNAFDENIPTLTADFTFFGGIYRDVYLEKMNKVHFGDEYGATGVLITTPQVSEENASLTFKGKVKNETSNPKKIKIIQEIKDADKIIVKKTESNLKLKAGEEVPFDQQIKDFSSPHLWSPEDPYLYEVLTKIVDRKTSEIIDQVSNPLGFRWFRFDKDEGFFLNDKHYKLIGTNRHQDYLGLGNAVPDALQIEDVELLKEMGGNFLRLAHYPQDPVILEACDKMGIITTVEIPIVNRITESDEFAENSKYMLKEMIYQNYNHPSLVSWSYMNEVLLRPKYEEDEERQKTYFKTIADLAKELEAIIRELDPYRYTTIPNHGSFSRYTEAGLTDIPMIVGWNLYSGWYGGNIHGFERFLDNHHDKLNKPLIVTEYGAGADPRLRSFNPERFDFTLEYQVYYHQHYLKEILKRPFVAGVNVWNLADFSSETRQDAMPYVNNKGIMTLGRIPKDAYYVYQAFLKKEPFIAIGSKLWSNRAGIADEIGKDFSTQPISVFTNLDKAKLLINGENLGEKTADENREITWDVPFSDGENLLEAISEVDGKTFKDFHKVDFGLVPRDLKNKTHPFEAIRVSLGSNRYFKDDLTHEIWFPSKEYKNDNFGFTGGNPYEMESTSRQSYGTDQNISGTDNDPIFQTQQVGIEEFKLDVPEGNYELTLHFAELVSGKEKEKLAYNLDDSKDEGPKEEKRVFDVLVNGETVLEGLNIAEMHGAEKAVSFKIKQRVENDQGISISFVPKEGKPILNALELRKIY